MIKEPAKATLRRYGLSFSDWFSMVQEQGWRCAVCFREPANGKLVIDHEHVPKWSKMKPDDRKKYVRGLLCSWDNWQFLRKGMTQDKALRLHNYLSKYNSKKGA